MSRFIGITSLVMLFCTSAQAQVVRQDLGQLFTLKHGAVAAAGLGLAAAAKTFDKDLKGNLENAFLLRGPADYTNIYGSSNFNLPASFSLWLAGKATGRRPLENLGSSFLRALALTQLVVAPIKFSVRRYRPDRSNRLSFPSGHAANSFALARLVHRAYGPYVGVPMYILGGFTAVGRMEENLHFLSDVVMGAVLGTIVGSSVTLGSQDNFRVRPILSDRGTILELALRF